MLIILCPPFLSPSSPAPSLFPTLSVSLSPLHPPCVCARNFPPAPRRAGSSERWEANEGARYRDDISCFVVFFAEAGAGSGTTTIVRE